MFKFEEIDKPMQFPKLPNPGQSEAGDCPVSGCFPPPSGFGGILCEKKVRYDLIVDPVEMHP